MPGPAELLKPCEPPKDVRLIFRRLQERAPRAAESETAPATSRTAADVRIGWYVPSRFLNDRGRPRPVSLDLCPEPGAKGRCECEGVRHFVVYTPSQRQAHRAAVAWAERCGTGEGIALALVGGVGTGKSHLFYAAIIHANRRGVNCGAWLWFDLAETLRAASSDSDRAQRPVAANDRERAKHCAALGLDEIRPTAGTEFDGRQLSNWMIRAYSRCQDVFATSNHAGDELASIVGVAASSRLTEITVVGPNHRDLKQKLEPMAA
jgi:hypothetical protein